MKKICLVIPCYNEETGLQLQEYSSFIEENPEVLICFVNDGSTDKTLEILEAFQTKFPNQATIHSYPKNVGKAEATRRGITYCNENYTFNYIAYLDADLATSLEECSSMIAHLNDDINFVFGSRIKILGSTIVRNRSRFLIGRVIATVISTILKLEVYDTQCGCKVFSKELSIKVFDTPFISKWLFDVEIFNRITQLYGHENISKKIREIPLKSWIEKGDSKVKTSYFFKLWIDLYRINKVIKQQKK